MGGFWELLAARDVLEVAGIAVIFVASTWATVLAIVYLIRKARIVKVSKGGVDFSGKDITRKKTPHSTCIHGKDIVMVLKKQAEMINAIHEAKACIIPEQMKYAEGRGADLQGLMQKNFLHLLDEEIEAGNLVDLSILDHEDYRSFKLCLKAVYSDILDFVRIAFRENHYSEKDEKEFRIYVDNKVNEIIQKATDGLNDMYRGRLIQRSRVYKENQRIISEIREILSDVFWQARAVAHKAKDDCKKIEKDFEDYLDETIG